MTEKSVLTLNPQRHENIAFTTAQSKESAIINNNNNSSIVSSNRAFGKDLSNLHEPSTNSTSTTDLNKSLTTTESKSIDQFRDEFKDRVFVELPKTTKDPLVASRALLSLRSFNDKDRPSVQGSGVQSNSKAIPKNLSTMENLDILNINNPQYVSLYAKEIFEYLLEVEEKLYAKQGFMTKVQVEVTEKMRGILVDWLVELHLKFKLMQETLYLAINILDRVLEKMTVTKSKLQLVGITAMFIAAKYQEIYPPEIKEFILSADKAFSKDDILVMEGKIILLLNFKLTIPSALCFLERFSRLVGMDQRSSFYAQYIIESVLLSSQMAKYRPSLIVCAAINLANKTMKTDHPEDILLRTLDVNEQTLKTCANDLYNTVKTVENSNLRAVKRKFLGSEFLEVTKIRISSS